MKNQEGLTIVELLISMTITAMLTGIIMVFFLGHWRQGITTQTELNALSERLNASDYLRENISASTGLINQNSHPDMNTGKSDPAFAGGEYWQVIHAYAGLIENIDPQATPVLYFKQSSVDSSRNIIFNGMLPYADEFIVYMHKDSKQLRVRTLADTAAPGNVAKTSCPPETATSTCPADKVLANDITGVTMRYFNRAGNEISYSVTQYTDTNVTPAVTYDIYGPDYPVVEVVELNLKLSKGVSFDRNQNIKTSTIIRVALRN